MLDRRNKACYNKLSYMRQFIKGSEFMTSEEILRGFSGNAMLRNAKAENIKKYVTDDSARIGRYRSGEIIYSPDSREKTVGIVLSGKVVAMSENALLTIIPESGIFGIANLYSDDCYPSTITAKTASAVLLIEEGAFKRLLENDEELLRAYLSFMSNRIVYLNKKISALTAGSAEKKLAVFLADNQQDGVYILPASISSLADMISVGRASLYRAMDSLVDEGLIERDGKRIIIKDKNALLGYS